MSHQFVVGFLCCSMTGMWECVARVNQRYDISQAEVNMLCCWLILRGCYCKRTETTVGSEADSPGIQGAPCCPSSKSHAQQLRQQLRPMLFTHCINHPFYYGSCVILMWEALSFIHPSVISTGAGILRNWSCSALVFCLSTWEMRTLLVRMYVKDLWCG